jgi:hypothetical protein
VNVPLEMINVELDVYHGLWKASGEQECPRWLWDLIVPAMQIMVDAVVGRPIYLET